jgi:hypothetical protein
LIRLKIIEHFRGTKAEPHLDEVAARLSMDRSTLLMQLTNEQPLTELAGLTLDDARRVMSQFPGLAIFSPDIEKAIAEFSETRGQIQKIEKMARGGGSPSGGQ